MQTPPTLALQTSILTLTYPESSSAVHLTVIIDIPANFILFYFYFLYFIILFTIKLHNRLSPMFKSFYVYNYTCDVLLPVIHFFMLDDGSTNAPL
jgi:hypothetical protein